MNNELLKEAEAAAEAEFPIRESYSAWERAVMRDMRRNYKEAYLAGVAKERERGGWQDIATAPKDGTLVDVWCDNGRVTDCMWSANQNGWGYKYGRYNDWIPVYGVTHWQILPSPPESITTKTTPDE